jgi:hypothetical protein
LVKVAQSGSSNLHAETFIRDSQQILRMKNRTSGFVLTGILILSVMLVYIITSHPIYAEDQKFKANLAADNEVPPVTSSADGKVKIKVKGDIVTSEINVTGIQDINGAHIYTGNKGENGEPIVDLLKSSNKSNADGRIIIQGEITPSDFEGSMVGKTLSDLQSSMATGGTYVNIQTPDHADGELRGQIKVSGSDSTKAESTGSNATTDDK